MINDSVTLAYLNNKKRFEIDLLMGKRTSRKSQENYLGIAIKTILPIESINRRIKTVKKFNQLIEIVKKKK